MGELKEASMDAFIDELMKAKSHSWVWNGSFKSIEISGRSNDDPEENGQAKQILHTPRCIARTYECSVG